MAILKNGNIVTPQGASLIFKNVENNDYRNLPYDIVITEESDDEDIKAGEISYNDANSSLGVNNVQGAIDILTEKIDDTEYCFSIEDENILSSIDDALLAKKKVYLLITK